MTRGGEGMELLLSCLPCFVCRIYFEYLWILSVRENYIAALHNVQSVNYHSRQDLGFTIEAINSFFPVASHSSILFIFLVMFQ